MGPARGRNYRRLLSAGMLVREGMAHEIVLFDNGTASVRNTAHGEAMHSSVGPAIEARHVYLEQTRIPERLAAGDSAPFIVYDLGLGIGANALAVIECHRQLGPVARPLRVISFENDTGGLYMGLSEPGRFPQIASHRAAVEQVLNEGCWKDPSGRIEWELRTGDFLAEDLFGVPAPDAIFFDFYSPKVTPDLWGFHVFDKLRKACGAKRCFLSTYSAATRVRSALLLAGFYVGQGLATSAKLETTLATTRLEDLETPLGAEWFEKFNRSARSMPEDLPPIEWEAARRRILGSSQALGLGLNAIERM